MNVKFDRPFLLKPFYEIFKEVIIFKGKGFRKFKNFIKL